MRTTRTFRIAVASSVVVLVVAIGVSLLAVHELHTMQFQISSVDVGRLELTLKKALSDVLVIKRGVDTGHPAMLTQGYAVAYEQNPEGFKADAKLFDTWSRAMALGTQALEAGPRGDYVRSSADADYASASSRFDPWDHWFCMLRRDDTLVVVSGGPNAPSSPQCKDVRIEASELSQVPHGRLLESPSGSLTLVIDRKKS